MQFDANVSFLSHCTSIVSMPIPPRITETQYLSGLQKSLHPFDIDSQWARFAAKQESPSDMGGSGRIPTLVFSTDVASVNSSQIEGNSIDVNFFINSKMRGALAKPKKREFREIEDLIAAYTFAQKHELNEKNFLRVHTMLSKGFLISSKRGVYRNHGMMIQSVGGIEYVALEAEFLPQTMVAFWDDMAVLLRPSLSPTEAFYHAALLHLVFVHIHPFSDGNGRSVRLLEKWFLAQHLGKRAWYVPSEAHYMDNRKEYYINIKRGVNYYELDYTGCVPFLAMLPESMRRFTKD
jgi:Fic family protein